MIHLLLFDNNKKEIFHLPGHLKTGKPFPKVTRHYHQEILKDENSLSSEPADDQMRTTSSADNIHKINFLSFFFICLIFMKT